MRDALRPVACATERPRAGTSGKYWRGGRSYSCSVYWRAWNSADHAYFPYWRRSVWATAIDNVQVKHAGAIKLHNLKTITKTDGDLVAVSRSGEIAVSDNETGRERERYKLPYGAVLKKGDGDEVELEPS